jgi:hypothetical protein
VPSERIYFENLTGAASRQTRAKQIKLLRTTILVSMIKRELFQDENGKQASGSQNSERK